MNYHDITKDDMINGDGLRAVLWVSGCSHHCKGCQNPITWDSADGMFFDNDAKKELFDELEKDYISGITFSGGDPMYEGNVEQIYSLIMNIRTYFPTKTIWLYTGFTFEEIISDNFDTIGNYRNMILRLIDVLVDGRFEEDKKDTSLLWKGSSNQRVIDVQKSLKSNKIILHSSNY